MISVEQILSEVKDYRSNHPYYRYGQAVFNYIDEMYGVSRKIQFEDHIDCFYNDDNVIPFVVKAVEYINE